MFVAVAACLGVSPRPPDFLAAKSSALSVRLFNAEQVTCSEQKLFFIPEHSCKVRAATVNVTRRAVGWTAKQTRDAVNQSLGLRRKLSLMTS